jgi:hypothetical protein
MDCGPTWDCVHCTLNNDGDAAACAACGTARGATLSESSLSESERENDSDGDYDMTGLDGAEDAAHTVAIHVARRKWEETEVMRVKARDEAHAAGVDKASHDEKRAAKAQIFTSQVRVLRAVPWRCPE